ncbi:aminopeptidase N, partial [Schumannella luteola]
SNGQQSAARARATIPTTEAKRAALEAALEDLSISNVVLRNMALGYTHTLDPSILSPLVAPYFDALGRIWSERTYHVAEYLVHGFYPATLASQELVDATRAWLDANPEPAALRRMVVEALAGVERALTAQERDAGR